MLARLSVGLLVLATMFGGLVPLSSQPSQPVHNMVIDRNLAIESGQVTPDVHEQMLSGGILDAAREARAARGGPGQGAQRARNTSAPANVRIRTLGCPKIFTGQFDNIKVNQDCSFRRKAEEFIVVDPNDPNHLVAGQNDSRIGFNHCGIDFSFDRGRHWGDQIPPFWQFLLLDSHVADFASDPALAFDAQGNVYFSCIVVDSVAAANAVVVTKSNAQFGGSFFHSPAANPAPLPGPQEFVDIPLGVVTTDNDPTIANDKEFIFSDIQPASPKRGRVYVTWTRFRTTVQGATIESPINFSQSTDGGFSWTRGVEISGHGNVCVGANLLDPNLPADKCSRDQGSWMVIGRDGTLYVFFNNANTPPGRVRQYLMVKCLGTADCTQATSWSAPVKVADDFNTQPFFASTDPVTGCPGGRRCLPPNGYRVSDEVYGTAAFDFTFGTRGRLYFAFADFRNGGPCAQAGNPPRNVEPCQNHNNDVFVVFSDDGGATWSGAKLVNNDDNNTTAQWMPWLAVGPDGIVYIAYYSRQFGSCESTGCNDIVLATSVDRGKTFKHFRITTSSMPNLLRTNNPSQAGFLGDYMNVAANTEGVYIVWADTRPHIGDIPTENVFFTFIKRSTFAAEK